MKDNEDVIVLPLSHFPDAQVNQLALSDDVTLLDDTRFSPMAPFELNADSGFINQLTIREEDNILASIKASSNNCEASVEKELCKENLAFKELPKGIVTFNNQIYVPLNKRL